MVSSTVSAVFLNNVVVLLTHKNLAGSFHLSEPGAGVPFRQSNQLLFAGPFKQLGVPISL